MTRVQAQRHVERHRPESDPLAVLALVVSLLPTCAVLFLGTALCMGWAR